MLGNASIIRAVADTLERYRVERLVIDPVMVAKSGARLLEEDAIATLRARLLPLALVVTPNLPEASVLLNRPVTDERDMQDAARDLHSLGPRYVLLKGGHLSGRDVVDLLYDGERFVALRAPRLETNHTHGTGCTYAAAIAALIARGLPVEEAVRQAHAYLHDAIVHAPAIGRGYGPVNHLVYGLPVSRG
jgi:hydroxymethylpyrimidine/phosphomethylpyrimidine kinase